MSSSKDVHRTGCDHVFLFSLSRPGKIGHNWDPALKGNYDLLTVAGRIFLWLLKAVNSSAESFSSDIQKNYRSHFCSL